MGTGKISALTENPSSTSHPYMVAYKHDFSSRDPLLSFDFSRYTHRTHTYIHASQTFICKEIFLKDNYIQDLGSHMTRDCSDRRRCSLLYQRQSLKKMQAPACDPDGF